ncbi:hypothetical protein B0H17DRAFT_1324528 [Mycena rosella]|uniref:AAA-ATPase-like domain-containing protein n=1 Tax=Mycena rosella TaxID=1033263 RepID=A0AAD7MC33_MYCRO|nr:hypothetical protein B0H17DRAFT_1324528 [Mycena rosella]
MNTESEKPVVYAPRNQSKSVPLTNVKLEYTVGSSSAGFSSDAGTAFYALYLFWSIGSKRRRIWSDDEDDDSSSDSEPDQKRVEISPISDPHLRLPRGGDSFLDFYDHQGTAFVDKTRCILELPDKFWCLLLRPPRFGKTSFLSTMEHYYNIHGAKHFSPRFGSLRVVTEAAHPIPRHSQHLCLSFGLSGIRLRPDMDFIASELKFNSSLALRGFLLDYATELQLSDPAKFFADGRGDPFVKVFELVRARGYTLFVGLDDYDTPTQLRSFAHQHYPATDAGLASARDIEDLVDSCFWCPLLAGADVIDKLLVTGTFLVKYSALDNLQPIPSLQTSCGFTEEEALTFARAVLDKTTDAAELTRSCGGYIFPSGPEDDLNVGAETLFHPQQIIARISQVSLQRPYVDRSFKLLVDLLGVLPEKSSVPGAVTLDGLVDLVAAGAVEINETDAALGFDATSVPWTALAHAGALTYDRQLKGTLRVANNTVLDLIHARIDTHFANRHDLRYTFLTTWSDYSLGDDPKSFLDLLSQVLCDLGRASFGRKYEPNMRGVLELVMRNVHISDGPAMAPILFANGPRLQIPGYRGYRGAKVHVWELNTLTLMGMWQATSPNDDTPTIEALRKLHEELIHDDEEHLLARSCRVWSTDLGAMETRLVGSFLDPEPEDPQFLAVGAARVLLRQRPTIPDPSNPDL